MFIKKPPGQLPIFDVRYQGQSVKKLIVSTDDVYKRLMSLKVSKSKGPDICHPRLMKETAESIKEPLQMIFDKTFKEGTLAEVFIYLYLKRTAHLAINASLPCVPLW